MLCIINNKDKIIAYTDSKKRAKLYTENMLNYHNEKLYIKKLPKDKKVNENLILVRYDDIYIQSAYVKYMRMNYDEVKYENLKMIELLERYINIQDMKKKDIKKVLEVIDIIKKYEKKNSSYTPSIEELSSMKEMYEPLTEIFNNQF